MMKFTIINVFITHLLHSDLDVINKHHTHKQLVYQERVQQLTGPCFWAIVLDQSAAGQLSATGPAHFSWIDF